TLYCTGVRKLDRVSRKEPALEALGAGHYPAQGLRRLRQCRGTWFPKRHGVARCRAFVAVDGDLLTGRALLHAHESRADARWYHRCLELERCRLEALPRWQARPAAEASRIDPLQLSDNAQEP